MSVPKIVGARLVADGLRGLARELDLAAAKLRREAVSARAGGVRADYAAAYGRNVALGVLKKVDEELPDAWTDTVGQGWETRR